MIVCPQPAICDNDGCARLCNYAVGAGQVRSPSIVPGNDLPCGKTWIQTLGSGWLDLANPDPKHINFRTIAIVLARVPRFAGHTDKGPYSVAQHCVEGARAILRDGHGQDAAKAFLLHDAHEAYIGDMATPLVGAMSAIATRLGASEYGAAVIRQTVRELKRELDSAIYLAAGVHFPLPAYIETVVSLYDLRMLRTERDARLAPPPAPWMDAVENAVPVEGCDLYPWSEDVSCASYKEMLRDFGILC